MEPFLSIGFPEIHSEGLLVLAPGHASPDPQTAIQFQVRFLSCRIELDLTGPFPFLAALGTVRLGFPPFLGCDNFFSFVSLFPLVIGNAGSQDACIVIQQVLGIRCDRKDHAIGEPVRKLVLHQEVHHGTGPFHYRAFPVNQRSIQHHTHRQFITLIQNRVIKFRGQHLLFMIYEVTGHFAG